MKYACDDEKPTPQFPLFSMYEFLIIFCQLDNDVFGNWVASEINILNCNLLQRNYVNHFKNIRRVQIVKLNFPPRCKLENISFNCRF